jgi:hypothetical protein
MTRTTAGDVEQLQKDFNREMEELQHRWFDPTREERTLDILATAFERLLAITQDLAERVEDLEATKDEAP